MGDRRQDTGSRDRLDELVASWETATALLDVRYRRVLVAAGLAVVLALGAIIGQWRVLRSTSHDSDRNQAALCALRGDLEQRVASSKMFLATHPNGIADVPAKTIRDGIANQQRTIDALKIVNCDT